MYTLTHTARTGPHICRFLVNTAPSNCWDGARVRGEDIEEHMNGDIEGQGTDGLWWEFAGQSSCWLERLATTQH